MLVVFTINPKKFLECLTRDDARRVRAGADEKLTLAGGITGCTEVPGGVAKGFTTNGGG